MIRQSISARFGMGSVLWFATCVAGPALLFFGVKSSLLELFGYWRKPEYSHGYFIPAIALLIGWHRLAEVKLYPRPAPSALVVIVFAMLLAAAGDVSTFKYFAFYGLIIGIAGYFCLYFGWHALAVAAPAVIYLFFAVPLPQTLFFSLSNEMQLLSTTLGFEVLDALGVPVFQDGNIVDLGGIKLQVVEACSGLRYLFPLMSFGYLAACILDDRFWKRAVLFLSTVPITIGMNSLRIALIGVTVDLWGPDMAGGLLHDFEGWTIFLACVALLVGEMALLVRIGHRRGSFKLSYLGLADGAPFLRMSPPSAWSAAGLVAGLTFAAVMTSGQIASREEIVPGHRLLSGFPSTLGAWRGRQGGFDPDVVTALAMDDYWVGLFEAPKERGPVEFYTAYYASQRIGSVAHSPSNCIPGSGWVIEDSSLRTIDLGVNDGALSIRRVLISKPGGRQLVYYWFDEAGREMASELAVKIALLRSSIVERRSDGALIRLVTPVGAGEAIGDADERLLSFARLVHPVIRAYLPGEEVAAR